MITNVGKGILAKYLIGQTPSYASHIAIGCGAQPQSSADEDQDYSTKTSLDFEMFRVPIVSRGYVNVDGQQQVVFTAELPTVERYEITEVGVYPAENNSIAVNSDSRNLYVFTTTEQWQQHTVLNDRAVTIPSITTSLDVGNNIINVESTIDAISKNVSNSVATITTGNTHNILVGDYVVVSDTGTTALNGRFLVSAIPSNTKFSYVIDPSQIDVSETSISGSVSKEYLTFQANADNATFTYLDRVKRYENCRFYNNNVAVRGDLSNLGFITVSSASIASNGTITYYTVDDHNLSTGNEVVVSGFFDNSFNTNETITSTPTSKQFTVSIGATTAKSSMPNDYGFIESSNKYSADSLSNHIHLTGAVVNLDNNSNDELRLAFSVVNKNGLVETDDPESFENPDKVRVLVEFISSEGVVPNLQHANFEIELVDGQDGVDFASNRYFVKSVSLDDLSKSINFAWSAVNVVKISATVISNDVPSDQFYVFFDAIRIENVTAQNPLYGLVGYTVMKTQNAETVLKAANTTNYAEFRFGFG